jgi:UDP-glucose 4-epimerase
MPPISIVILHGVTTHVRDIVRGLVLTAEHELTGVDNLGTGEVHSFNTVVEMLNDELGTDVDPAYVENPIPEDIYVHDTCADPSKMSEETGWQPEISFEEGIRRVCAAYQ